MYICDFVYIFAGKYVIMKGIANKVGPCVEKEDFYGRKNELNNAWRLIETGHSLILAAPRRVGKTSFAKKISEYGTDKGWAKIYMNLEKVKDIKGFVSLFKLELEKCQKWPASIGRRIKNIGRNFKLTAKLEDVEYGVEWRLKDIPEITQLQKMMDSLGKEKIIIVCDELTVLLKKIADMSGLHDAEHFLNLLRSFRTMDNCANRWVFCSSISIESFLESNTLSKCMNDVERFVIDELNEEESHGLILELSLRNGYTFRCAERSHMLKKIGLRLPYYIQMMYSEIYNIKGSGKNVSVTTKDIDEAYIAITKKQHYFATWSERLRDYPEEQELRKVLKILAQNKEGCTRNILMGLFLGRENVDELVTRLITILNNDGYIMLNSNMRYVFRSFLLRDYWYYKFIA